MKFFAFVVVAVICATVSANPNEQMKYQSQYGQARGAAQQQHEYTQQKEIHHKDNQQFDMGLQGREFDDDSMSMGVSDHQARDKKSYGSGAKCGKAVVVGCAPLVQKVKCKGSKGGHEGAYSENYPKYAYPQEYETAGPYFQYV